MNRARLAKIRELEVLGRGGYLHIAIHRSARIHASAQIGPFGQGFERAEGGLERMAQLGGLVVGPDVEIGPNATIMLGALSDTRIGARTSVGNGVNVGHGAEIGPDCILAAHATVGGSARIGANVTLYMAAVVGNKVAVGDGATIGAGAVVRHDVGAGETWAGNPARRIDRTGSWLRLFGRVKGWLAR